MNKGFETRRIGGNQIKNLSILLNFSSNLKVVVCKIKVHEARAYGNSL